MFGRVSCPPLAFSRPGQAPPAVVVAAALLHLPLLVPPPLLPSFVAAPPALLLPLGPHSTAPIFLALVREPADCR